MKLKENMISNIKWMGKICYQENKRDEEKKRGGQKKENQCIKKKSHHVSTEPLLYIIHDRGLRYGDLKSKAMDKPQGCTKATKIRDKQTPTKHKTEIQHTQITRRITKTSQTERIKKNKQK